MGNVEQLFRDVQSRQDRAASIAATAVDDNPDDAAESIKLGNMTGAPASAIYSDVDGFKSQAKASLSGDIVSHNKLIADYVASHPLAAKVSNDDWANLDTISRGAQSTSALIRMLNAPRSIAAEAASDAFTKFREGWGGPLGQEIYNKYPDFYNAHPAAFVAMAAPWMPFEIADKLFRGIGAGTVGGVEGAATAAHFAMFGDHTAAENFGSDTAYLAEYLMSKGEMPKLPALYAPHLREWMANGMEPPRGIDPAVDKGKADLNAAVLDKVEEDLKASQTSTTRERSAEMYRQYMAQHYGDASVSVHGEAVSALYGDKIPEEGDGILGWVKGIQDKLASARSSGDDVHIPLRDLMTDIDESVFKALKDDIRVWPGGITKRESTEVNVPKDVTDSPLAMVRAAAGTEPMYSIGDRKLKLESAIGKTVEEWAQATGVDLDEEGGINRQYYQDIFNRVQAAGDMYGILDDKGNVVGSISVKPQGKQLYVNSIYGLGDFGPNDFGPSLIRDLKRQLKALYPEQETITGDRVSGARYGKAADRVSLEEKFDPNVKLSLADDIEGFRGLLNDAHLSTGLGGLAIGVDIKPLTERSERLNRAIEDEVRRIAGGAVEVTPAEGITTQHQQPAHGIYIRREGLLPAIIYDLYTDDPIGVARHEAIHFMRSSGLIKPEEWDTLARAAQDEGWLQKHDIPSRYAKYNQGVHLEEAVAEEYRDWAASQVPHPNAEVHGIFEKLKAFWENLKQRFNEIFGGEQNWEQIFQQIHEGRLANRQADLGQLAGIEPLFARGLTVTGGGVKIDFNTLPEREAANINTSRADILKMLPKPKTQLDKFIDHTKGMSGDEILSSEALWGEARNVAMETGEGIAETFAKYANIAFSEHGLNRYITPTIARRFMAQERLKYGLPLHDFEPRFSLSQAGEPKFSLDSELNRIKNSVHGLDQQSYRRLRELVQQRYTEDLAAAQARAEREQTRRQSKEWRDNSAAMSKEVEETIRQRPDVAADLFIGAGELGSKKLRQRYTLAADDLSTEQRAGLPPHYVSKNGLPVDQVASLFGFRSGDAMIQKLSEYNSIKEGRSPREMLAHVVDLETERQMEAKYGTLQHNIMSEAVDQAFSETNLNLQAEEMLATAMAQKVTVIDKAVAKEQVRAEFAKKTTGEVSSSYFRDKVGEASRNVERAAIAGDWAAVVRGLQTKYLNSLKVAEALKLEKELARFAKDIKPLGRDVIPGMDPEYSSYIHQILGQVGAKVRPNAETIAARIEGRGTGDLKAFVDTKTSFLREMPVWPTLYDAKWHMDYLQLPVEDFRAVRDSIKTLAFNGRNELKVKKGEDVSNWADIKGAATANIQGFAEKHYDRQGQRWLGPIPPGKVSDVLRAYGVSHLQVPTMLERMDHRDPNGPLTQYVTRPLLEGDGILGRLKKQFSKILADADDKVNVRKSIDNNLFRVPGSQDFMNMTIGSRRVVMLNLGTNLQELAGGYHVRPEDVLSWVNKSATAEDWAWVNKIWDMYEVRRELSDEMYRSLTGGVEGERLEGIDIETPSGTVPGRYFPIIHHPDFQGRSAKLIGGIEQDNFVSALPTAGYMKSRTGYQAPLALDLDMLPARLSQELRDIAMRPALIQASKVLLDPDIQEAIRTHLGKEWRNQLQPYLRELANGGNYIPKDQKAVAGALEFIRTNTMSTLVGANLGTVAKHGPTALVLSMKEVGPVNFLRALKGLFSINEETGERNWRYMMDKSNIMPFRTQNFEETLTGSTQKLISGGSYGSKFDSMRHTIIRYASAPLALSDGISSWGTWWAAYDKAIRDESEGDAIYLADRAVQRTHGTTSAVFKSGIVRGTPKWFTGFYNLFSNVLQRQFELTWDAGEALGLAKGGQKMAAMAKVPGLAAQMFAYVIAVALVEELVSPLETDPHASWEQRAAKATLGGLAYGLSSSWIGIRDFAHLALAGGDATVGLFGTAFKTSNNVAHDIAQATGAERAPMTRAHAQHVIEDASTMLGLATGLPGAQVGRTAAFGFGLAKGIEHPQGWDWVHGVRHGTVRERRQ